MSASENMAGGGAVRAVSAVYRAAKAFLTAPRRLIRRVGEIMPKGLFVRSLIIIIAPIVILQSVVAYVFMERHWQLVTRRLSSAVSADIAALIDIYQLYPQPQGAPELARIALERLGLDIDFLPGTELPQQGPKPFFSILDEVLTDEIRKQVGRPFWIDTVGRSNVIEIRIKLNDTIMRVFARRSLAYASNSHIFLIWMLGTSLVLVTIAILFQLNQIRPILRLADAAEDFGKGREIDFRPRGAREVRRAGRAFVEMKRRIERAMEQRTTMLNGVSHDLRTILTRFKLSLALMHDDPEIEDLRSDVEEMERMLEAYLAFARGDAGEQAEPTDIRIIMETLRTDYARQGREIEISAPGDMLVTVRPFAFQRLLGNLVANAVRYGTHVSVAATRMPRWLTISVDDDGPGISADQREEAFKAFVRLDIARNVDDGGTGLGLAIARDIARSHGGDVSLSNSPLGGLRATIRLPV
ncbi:ATP-binding protein [Pseudochelatococcus sp. G4_1912]|uniref:ATP-binding protein n=1 Tax=Pseudochelatococcus sp. G4_1912 TaxID=3114288 RepID=UPI0039C637F6